MENYKFGDKVVSPDGKATVQEDQDNASEDVKVQVQGEDVFKVFKSSELQRDFEGDK